MLVLFKLTGLQKTWGGRKALIESSKVLKRTDFLAGGR